MLEDVNFELVGKLHKFKKELSSISKGGENKFQKFKYFKLSDLFNEVVYPLEKQGILTYCYPKEMIEDVITYELKFIDIELKATHRISYPIALDTAQSNRVQASGSTWTYAYRYGLQMFFAITDDKDDPDAHDNSPSKLADKSTIDKVSKHLVKLGLTEPKQRIEYLKSNHNCTPSSLTMDVAVNILKAKSI